MNIWTQNNDGSSLTEHTKNAINLKAICKHVNYHLAF